MGRLPTVKIRGPSGEEGYVIINESDFDPSLHEPYGDDFPERLLGGGGAEESPSLDGLTKDELLALCDERGIDPDKIEGTGKGGYVVKDDLVAALEAGA